MDFANRNSIDLCVWDYGYENCKPGHSYGPAVREYFLFHYIFSGSGFFRTSDTVYHLKAGQGFLICPHDLNYYQADSHTPWSYGWFGITGTSVPEFFADCGLTGEAPIWQSGSDEQIEAFLLEMNSPNHPEAIRQLQVTGYVYLILSRMIEKASLSKPPVLQSNRQEAYLQAAIRYMEQYYYKDIKIEDVANYVGLDRSYLGSLFKKHLNTSMQSYLLELRLNKACSLLKNAELRVADVARSVGYGDQLQFCKIFKAYKGVNPSQYRMK